MQDGQRERRRLARARLSGSHEVAAGEHGGYGLLLDRGRGGITFTRNSAKQGFVKPEFGKMHVIS